MPQITGAASLGFSHYTLYEALPRLASIGFRKVEISSFDSYCFHFNYGSPTPEELKAMLNEHGLEAVSLNYFARYYNAWEASEIQCFVEDWHRKLKQLSTVGIRMMTMSFGIRNDRNDQQPQLENAAKAFSLVGEIAKDYGVRMLLEVPHLYSIMNRPEKVLDVFNRLTSDNVGALIDSSHWGIIGYDLDGFVSALGTRLWHIHLRDSGGPDTGDFRQELELTPGKGTVDFAQMAQCLDRHQYRGEVFLDFEYRDTELPQIMKEYANGLRYLQSCGWTLPDGIRLDDVR
ncbi:MAG: xylose isomerase [Paenibacillus sp.]|nr:xylose isomerase [Paenibacillus sp.]